MDYKYIELERQIKSLMNKNFVVTSTRSKSAEELSNGSCQLYVDTIQKYFIFKVSGMNESIYINPLTNSLMNVQYINGVDVSNLFSSISAGYGIDVENLTGGVFKINVKENMFALKNEVDEVNDKFSNYYTKSQCDGAFVKSKTLNDYKTLVSTTYSTKTELTNGLANHYTKTESDAKYNTISDFNTYKTFVTNNYATKTSVATDLLNYYTKTETDKKFALKTEIGTGGNNYDVDKLLDMFTAIDSAPDSPNSFMFNDSFVFNDEHVMSSKATKMLIDKSMPTVDLSSYYTGAQCDNKYAPKTLSTYLGYSVVDYKVTSLNPNGGGGSICIFKGLFGDYVKIRGTMNGTDYEYEGQIGNYGDLDTTVITLNVSVPGTLTVRKAAYYTGYLQISGQNITYAAVRSIKRDEYVYKSMIQSDYYDKSESDSKYALKSSESYTKAESDSKYVKTSGDSTINGSVSINSSSARLISLSTNTDIYDYTCLNLITPNISTGRGCGIAIGKSMSTNKAVHLYYNEPGVGGLALYDYLDIITFTNSRIDLNRNTYIDGNLYVTGTFKPYNSSQTITHYAPVEGDIKDFVVGVPVFMSGKVYKRDESEPLVRGSKSLWIESTNNDREDCICSVMINGNEKNYVGVVVDVDEKNNSVTFATHGDFMFNVDDSNNYEVGDVVLYDGRILDENVTLTLKLQRSIVGTISGIIDENTVAIFRT